MENHPFISQALMETEAYKDLQAPVILASGELGIYYVNTEKLLQDNEAFNAFSDNANAMISYAVQIMKHHAIFNTTIDILAIKAAELLDKNKNCTISGGQRRDWLFSGPVAYRLGIPHIAIYKNGKREMSYKLNDGFIKEPQLPPRLQDRRVLHIADIITEGSSIHRGDCGIYEGWVPWLRADGANIEDVITVVTRQQSGEEMLQKHRINVHSFVAIDQNFLRKHSKNPEQACAYHANPKLWSENYLKEHGAIALLTTFDPKSGKTYRAQKFLRRYETVLQTTGKLDELNNAVKQKYSISLKDIR